MDAETLDSKGKFVKIGTRVRVLAIPPCDPGLGKKEMARINSMLGEEFVVYEIDEYGRAWVEKSWETGSDTSASHRLALRSNEMERVG